MSLESWCAEYIPHPFPIGRIEAIKHSIHKWEGLRNKDMARHKVWVEANVKVRDEHGFVYVDYGNCALCELYADNPGGCSKCPCYGILGESEPCDRAWNEWVNRGITSTMLRLLRRALELEERRVKQS